MNNQDNRNQIFNCASAKNNRNVLKIYAIKNSDLYKFSIINMLEVSHLRRNALASWADVTACSYSLTTGTSPTC